VFIYAVLAISASVTHTCYTARSKEVAKPRRISDSTFYLISIPKSAVNSPH
jgi:hypothetical protein